ncbi:hypothetical protein FH972_026067 [Carpinus fangiana]|uniref:Major facilitator superfamily (MFS) profile domain-containing protein n=1 Tax=Carpinus fangiana TaxID=176857 RepID=A0A5N6L5H1_9ROSI|nr:hypothetical protein FH972_026067 [Carpinus fangiana]
MAHFYQGDDPMAMYQAAMLHQRGGVPRRFDEYYRCYPVAMMPGPDREGVNYGGKVFLPPSALEKLMRLHIAYPMLFELINGAKERQTHAGVLEFIAEEGKIYLPSWAGDLIQIKSTDLPPGTFIKLQPQSPDFLDITDPKAVLENAFRNFSCMTVGDVFSFEYNDHVYDIAVLEVKPDGSTHAICTMETDLSVDFAEPIGYQEYAKAQQEAHAKAKPNATGGTVHTEGTMAQAINYSALAPKADGDKNGLGPSVHFSSGGNRLGAKRNKGSTGTSTPTVPESTLVPAPKSINGVQPLRLPHGKLFFGFPYKKPPPKKEDAGPDANKPHFQGMGQTLRGKKIEATSSVPTSDSEAASGGQKLGRRPRDANSVLGQHRHIHLVMFCCRVDGLAILRRHLTLDQSHGLPDADHARSEPYGGADGYCSEVGDVERTRHTPHEAEQCEYTDVLLQVEKTKTHSQEPGFANGPSAVVVNMSCSIAWSARARASPWTSQPLTKEHAIGAAMHHIVEVCIPLIDGEFEHYAALGAGVDKLNPIHAVVVEQLPGLSASVDLNCAPGAIHTHTRDLPFVIRTTSQRNNGRCRRRTAHRAAEAQADPQGALHFAPAGSGKQFLQNAKHAVKAYSGQISFTFILPLFPKLLEFYRDLDASAGNKNSLLASVLNGLNAYKNSFSRPINDRYDIVLLGGALGSLFSFLQAIASPFIGRLSDKYGRRRALLVSMTGNILSVALWVAATDFRTFLASRVVGGLSEGNVQLALAIATDISDEKQRGATMALVGACFSIAFTFGPALGAFLSTLTLVAANPFAAAAGFSLFLIVTETIYLYAYLPETLPSLAEKTTTNGAAPGAVNSKLNPTKVRTNSFAILNLSHFVFVLFFSGMEFSLSFMTYDLFSYDSKLNGRLLGFIGLVASILQGGVTRRMHPLRVVQLGVVSCTAAFFLLARLETQGTLYAAAALLAVTSATVVTGLNSLSSFEAASGETGGKLGNHRSFGQMGRSLGPLIFCSLYWWAGRDTAYMIGGTGMIGVTALVFGALKKPPIAPAAKKTQ